MHKRSLFLLLFCSINSIILAQNYLYDTEQFGIKGATLGGSVIAGADDESMTFYNPAAIHKAPSQVSVSLFQPAIRTFGFDNFWGGNETSQLNTNFGLRPSLISFKVNIKGFDIAFIKISKSVLTDTFSAKRERTNGNDLTTQFFEYKYTGEDSWFGVGSSFNIAPKMHLGLSQFLTVADFSYGNNILIEQFDMTNNSATSNSFFNAQQNSIYGDIGFITKLGFLYDSADHDFGVTITTPKYLRVNSYGEFTSTFVNIDSATNESTQIIDNEIDTEIKTPWEFSLGYSYLFETGSKIWATASYYSSISEYEMGVIESVSNNASWVNGSEGVFNVGIGYSRKINNKIELSGGLRTNNFAYRNRQSVNNELRNTILDGNHIHFVVGTKFEFRRHNVLVGLDWGTLVEAPGEGNFQFLNNIGRLSPNLRGLKKNNINVLLTYRFIIDELIKL
ncbi:hypothetical protein [uncultured Tenacibaculum sp.]|uniref:hypothetical protein n=1 Tax=uncultured Tenacibaculum sp. TaxID=174713 RepID=UPI00261F5B47|nr:hypothetical protein [uncultured Tenacibaculum sp.]